MHASEIRKNLFVAQSIKSSLYFVEARNKFIFALRLLALRLGKTFTLKRVFISIALSFIHTNKLIWESVDHSLRQHQNIEMVGIEKN